LLVTAVHTHSSFGGIFDTAVGIKRELRSMFGETDEALLAMLAERCARAVKEAMADMAETDIRFSKGSIDRLGTNRHSPELPHDRDLFIIELFRADGKKILLYNLSCHPTVLNGGNLLISADFPGTVASRLRGDYDMVVFVNGSAGDVSTRFTRRESSFAECDRLGTLAAGRIMELTAAAGAAEPLERVELTYHEFCLKEAAVDEADAAETKLAAARRRLDVVKSSAAGAGEIRYAESFVEAAFLNLKKAKAAGGRPAGDIALRTGILFINDKTILCVPLELFSSLRLKSRIPVELFGYANAVKGYLADMAAYESLDYEALSSPFAAGEGERYIVRLAETFGVKATGA
jgi:hypothetical protein